MHQITDLVLRSIKILDIGYITLLYFALAFIASIFMDQFNGTFDEKNEEKKSTTRLFIELTLQIWVIGILIYFARNIVEVVPFPLNGIFGYNHHQVKELHTAQIFTVMLFYYQIFMRNKMKYLYSRISRVSRVST